MTIEFYQWIYEDSPERWGKKNKVRSIDWRIGTYLEKYKDKKIKILDLGCGIGNTLASFRQYDWELYGIDYVAKAIQLAEENLKDRAVLKVGDIARTRFQTQFFDVVYSLGVYEHVDNPNFNEPRRILKDGGIFICHVPLATEKKEGRVETNFYDKTKLGVQFENFHKEQYWIDLLEKSGFEVTIPRKTIFICNTKK